MTPRRRFRPNSTLEQRLSFEAERLRKEAQGTPPGVARDDLLRRARQAETAIRMNEWLSSPGAQPPSSQDGALRPRARG